MASTDLLFTKLSIYLLDHGCTLLTNKLKLIVVAQDLPAFASEESSHTQKEHSFSSGLKIQTKNQNSRQEELIFWLVKAH